LVILLVLVKVIYSEKIVNISRVCNLDKEWELTTDKDYACETKRWEASG